MIGVDKQTTACHNTYVGEKVFTVAEASECLGVCARQVRWLARQHRVGDKHGPSGMYTFTADDLYVMQSRRVKWRRAEKGEKVIG